MNVNCRDLDRSRAFYEALGLRASVRTAPGGVQSGAAFGLDRAQWDAWILSGADALAGAGAGAGGGVIDLLEWQEPAPTGEPPGDFHTQGWQRMGVLVPDLDGAINAVTEAGGSVWGAPSFHGGEPAEGAIRLVVANDPDGTIVELVEAGGPLASFVGLVCADLERSVAWYKALGFREAARFGGTNEDSAHLHIDGPSAFDEVMMTAPGGGLSLILVGFTTPPITGATPRPANAVGIWRVALLVDDLDTEVAELDRRSIELISRPVEMSMGADLPQLRFACFRGPNHEVLELIEQPR